MFVFRFHATGIDLRPNEEILYRLPPMSAGPIFINAKDAYFTTGPHGQLVSHSGPTSDLELELRHASHLSLRATNHFTAESLWQDDFWRLRVKRIAPGPEGSDQPLHYTIDALYPSQLPILERHVPASFFHDGFEVNWNQQQYVRVALIGNRIEISFREDLARLQGLPTQGDPLVVSLPSGVSFSPNVAMISQRLDMGAGPLPGGSGNAPFISLRAEFPAVKLEHEDLGTLVSLSSFHITIRLFLKSGGKVLEYLPVMDTNVEIGFGAVLDIVDSIGGPDEQEVMAEVKKAIEEGLYQLQFRGSGASSFGLALTPWLVGGPIDLNPLFSVNDLFSIGYAPGPGDVLRPDGLVEPATGELVVRYVGPRVHPVVVPVVLDPTHGTPSAPVDDGAIPLFDVPEEVAPPPPGSNRPPFGGQPPQPGGFHPPDIGALSKIDHIVVLMQENRSFDQVLGYLSRNRINPKVDGLLPPDDPGHAQQVNVFKGVSFFPQLADKNNPPGNPPRPRAIAWPIFPGADGTPVGGPCHDTDCVSTQVSNNMGGFVADFAARTGGPPPNAATNPNLRLVMDYFDGTQLRFFDLLAREFSISDRWYTSHPGPTWPNRFVLLTGDLNQDPLGRVELDNTDVKALVPVQTPSLFDILTKLEVPWRLFEHGMGFGRLFRNLTFDTTNIVPFEDPVRGFEAAARTGTLPPVTLIEPDYIDLPPGNDDHPPADMADGQVLIERIVKALVDSPTWNKTLFIITYDEHGGFYDHKQPPSGAPPLRGGGTTLGPRVPTFFISPLVPRGEVFFGREDSGRFFDHTSIGATILRRFSGRRPTPSVSPRMDAARDLREVLTLNQPRPRSDFDVIRQFTRAAVLPAETRSAAARTQSIGEPESPGDFHWMMSAIRLTTGEPPKATNLSRRGSRGGAGELLYYRDQVRPETGDLASPTIIGLGGWQNFKFLFSGGNGILYAVNPEGQLLFYRDKTQDGTGDVGNPAVIGLGGWQNFKFLFSGGNGILYAVDQQGRLLFYRDQNRDGTGDVANPTVIGQGGWQTMRHLFSGGNGILYAVDQQGRLLFYRDKNQDGTGDVANPGVIGLGGWQAMSRLFSGGDGAIYAVDPQGQLLLYHDRAQDGTGDVASPTRIGLSGWHLMKHLFSGGHGILYAVRP